MNRDLVSEEEGEREKVREREKRKAWKKEEKDVCIVCLMYLIHKKKKRMGNE